MNRISVLSYLDETYLKYPDKTAFFSEAGNMTFLHLYQYSRSAGSYLADSGYYRKPIVVFMRKSSEMIAAFLGVVRGGCYYVPIDEEMPEHRIALIFETLRPELVICDGTTARAAQELQSSAAPFRIVSSAELRGYPVNEPRLRP